jgi:hypothetical protein
MVGGLMADRAIREFELALRQLGPRDQNLAEVVKAASLLVRRGTTY